MPRQRIADLIVDKLQVNHGLTVLDTSVSTAVLLASGQAIDLNGETGGIVIDADANSKLYPSADNELTLNLNGASDFKWAANNFHALSGSVISTNTISEETAASGVTVDGALIKDGGFTGAAGPAAVAIDIISEVTSAAGVTVDGVLIKDTAVYGRTPVGAVTADGAITITAYNKIFAITKAGVAAMTIVDPTATTHDGVELTFIATTANAHTLDNSAGSGFFSSGGATKDVATFGGAIGDGLTIVAYQGKWYIKPSSDKNITLG